MKKLLHGDILKQRLTAEEALKARRHPVSVLLDSIRSLYNVGSIFRTADSALVEELILCGFTPHPPRKEIEKTALGAVDTVPWRFEKNAIEAIAREKAKGKKIIAVELTDSSVRYNELKPDDYPMCLVLGNELVGINDDVLAACDASIEIPMYGVKHSLNVSVAAGIAVYEAVRIYNSCEYNR